MNKKNISLLVVALAIIAIGAYYFFTKVEVAAPTNNELDTKTEIVGYSGLTVEEAESEAKKDGVMFRVVEKDGDLQPTTRDFQEGRINAVVKNNVVISFTIETMNPVLEDKTDQEPVSHDSIIGMNKIDAEAYAKTNGVDFRVVSIDGEALPVTLDLRMGRISATVVNNIVVGYTTE